MKKNRRVHAIIFTSIASAVPVFASAQGVTQVTSAFNGVGTIVNSFTTNIVTALITLFATAAMAAFFYGIVQYIWGVREAKPDKVTAGNKFMVWGLVALFVMFSVWGIIIFIQNIFGIQGQNTIVIPKVQIQNSSGGTGNNNGTGNTGLGGAGNGGGTTPVDCQTASAGTACTTGGRAGTCGTNENGVKGCYATPTGGTQCGPNEIMTANGCVWQNGF
jgi:hypothetical protein